MLIDASLEQTLALHLDPWRYLIGVQLVTAGPLVASAADSRDVFEAALRSHTAALIVAHHRPSADLILPTWEDRTLCERLRQAGELLGVPLLDFVIISDPAEGVCYHSFKEAGVL